MRKEDQLRILENRRDLLMNRESNNSKVVQKINRQIKKLEGEIG